MPIDYSKWKDIEVSDDEDDTHPNIDTASLFRWRHQARLERMASQKQEREGIEDGKRKVSTRLKEIEEKLLDTSIGEREHISLKLEMQEIKKQEEEFLKKEEELAEKERLQPWNVDTIGHEGWSKTLINKPKEKSNVSVPKENDEESGKKLSKYVEDNEELLNQFSLIKDLDEAENFLMEHPHLASDYASSYLAIEALNCAIVEDYSKMDKIAVNCITLQYLLEFAKMLHAIATNTTVIRNFFKKIRQADPGYMKMYRSEVDAFRERLCKRAREKRQAAVDDMEALAKQKRIAESPGGLDPQEVLDSLPQDMQEAFQTQSIEKMYHVAESMDPEVFKYHMQRCIDSGLWVPNSNKSGNDEDDNADGEGTSGGCAADIEGSGEALATAGDD